MTAAAVECCGVEARDVLLDVLEDELVGRWRENSKNYQILIHVQNLDAMMVEMKIRKIVSSPLSPDYKMYYLQNLLGMFIMS